ncbi:MAG: methyl-accepting chemotaxis protein [Candidatus Accumulibacter phosphatis]|uniref:Methyl-accepting chemotaxis protein n=3 Tax=Candidatus Accumulibacter TaxID=327159 RepID=A0A080M487_9PROT|nr:MULTISPECIES: methyl-accepting chemotaxis protein [Candidatus Accumulibacter]KFB75295.1 MAG: Ribose and galactose chemoreceptor protein [Candidatus Accumulibacter cognatus]MBL8402666.1 methyl-accepting chemotaxis protein [Accumulibacter sp.]MBN8518788.1 methyl-accepting chemotaxis protein [Accumulibacter sp.]MBO3711315.1 methyl-accepting chemotaxis protein [Accumulibacter sp.]MCC2868718.1 methyl-accepting chemotaxis protein [Candidatus Accumulibacter phosphatis]
MTRFSLRIQLLIVTIALASGFLVFGACTWQIIKQTKIGSPHYDRIVLYKDLVADILPPPNYIIESYLTVLQIANPDRIDDIAILIGKLQQLQQDYDKRHRFWTEQLLPASIKTRFLNDAHAPAVRFFEIANKEFVPAAQAGDATAIRTSMYKLSSNYAEHRKAIDDVVLLSSREQTEVETSAAATVQSGLSLLLLVFLLSAALAAAANYIFGKSLLAGIREARQRLGNIANGLLDQQLKSSKRTDEIGDLLRSLDTTTSNLRLTVGEIRAAAQTVSTSAAQLSATIATIADSAHSQSASVNDMVATVEQMSSGISMMAAESDAAKIQVQQAGERCDQGSAEITSTTRVVEHLTNDVQGTAESMRSLGEHSREISGIVSVIREIADQTNLLALNAAIEAARAGEQGRGFAVVADEVRKLAERTAQSTDRITTMITQIQSGIENAISAMGSGSLKARESIHAVQAAKATMDAIAVETGILINHIQQIAQGLGAQNQSSSKITAAISGIAIGARENSSAAAQVSTTATDLATTAHRLRAAAEFFRL